MNCKYCKSPGVIKFGQVKGVQRHFCKSCNRKFVFADTIPKMQTATSIIADVLNMYYEGMSENEICRSIFQQDGKYISAGSVYNWVRRFTGLAALETSKHIPKVSREWTANESALKLVGKSVWFWDIIDNDTHFLIASNMSFMPTGKDAQVLMKQAYERTKVIPRVFYTDKLVAYLDGIELTFGVDIQHGQDSPFKIEDNPDLIDQFHATFKKRTRVMHNLRSLNTIKRFMEGWLVHYNYFRPNISLAGKTPAELAGVNYPFRNWKEVIEQPYAKTARIPIAPLPII